MGSILIMFSTGILVYSHFCILGATKVYVRLLFTRFSTSYTSPLSSSACTLSLAVRSMDIAPTGGEGHSLVLKPSLI